MYLVEKELAANDGKHYLQVYVCSACCKRRFLVEIRGDTYYDIENCEPVSRGYKLSIDMALKEYRRNAQTTKPS